MKALKFLLTLFAMVPLLAGCGGGSTLTGSKGTGGGSGGGSTSTVAAIYLSSSTSAILADGSTTATITAVAVNSSHIAVSGATVSITATSGNLVVASATTDSSGTVSATLNAGTNATLRTITVTASAGSASATTPVQVIASGSTSPAAQLTLVSSTPTILSDGSTTANIQALVRDSSNNLIPNVPVAFTASSGGIVAVNSVTDATGAANATLSTAGDPTLRTITVTAKVNTVTATVKVQVVAATGSSTVQMGSGTGSSFKAGVIGASSSSLSAGGSTSLQVVLQQSDGTLYTSPASITFSSPCAAQNESSLTTPVATTSGIAVATYAAKGCSGTDVVTATATIGTTSLSATTTLTIAPSSIGSINFVSATPTLIALSGIGSSALPNNSTVIFQVLTQAGAPRPGATVTFSLDTSVGGVSLVSSSGVTDANGNVQTVVQSGTVATPVRVTATVSGVSPAISTQSSQLIISTGIPQQDSFSLAVGYSGGGTATATKTCTNVEGWAIDGVQVGVTARLSDRFNNPVPDGTAVSFHTEGGQIAGSCTTTTVNGNSSCSVNWTSQNPRPPQDPSLPFCTSSYNAGANTWVFPTNAPCDRPGRSSLLAVAIGEESFTDVNGNGQFDANFGPPATPGGTTTAGGKAAAEPWSDLPYRFLDKNESGTYVAGDYFYDFANLGGYEYPNASYPSADAANPLVSPACTGQYCGDGKFNGVLCNDPNNLGYCGPQSTGIGAGNLIIMSDGTPSRVLPAGGATLPALSVGAGGNSYQFFFADRNNNPLPAGTTITASTSTTGLSVAAPTSFTVPCTTEPTGYAFTITASSSTATSGSGIITLTVVAPSSLTTVLQYPIPLSP